MEGRLVERKLIMKLMKLMKAVTFGLAMMLSTVVANAAEQPNKAAAPNERMMIDKLDQRVCRYESQVGTHFKKRTCRTRRQWQQEDETNQAMLRDEFNRLDAHSLPSPGEQ